MIRLSLGKTNQSQIRCVLHFLIQVNEFGFGPGELCPEIKIRCYENAQFNFFDAHLVYQ